MSRIDEVTDREVRKSEATASGSHENRSGVAPAQGGEALCSLWVECSDARVGSDWYKGVVQTEKRISKIILRKSLHQGRIISLWPVLSNRVKITIWCPGWGSNLKSRTAMPLRPYPFRKNKESLIHFPLHLIPATEGKTWSALSYHGQSYLNRLGKRYWYWLKSERRPRLTRFAFANEYYRSSHST